MRYVWLMLVCCAGLGAREIVVTKSGDAETPTIHLRNTYHAAATAWVVGCEGMTDPKQWTSQWRWSDQLLGFEGKPLEPGQETEYKVTKRPAMMNQKQPDSSSKCEDFRMLAAVFADGTVSGDLSWIHSILGERQQLYKDLGKVVEILNKNIADGGSGDAAVKQLSDWMEVEAIRNRPGKPSAKYGESTGWRSQEKAPSSMVVQSRPFVRAAGPGVAMWLIDSQKKDVAEAVKVIAEWRTALGKWDAVRGPAVTGAAPGPMPMMTSSTGGPPMGMGEGSQPNLIGKPAPEFTLKDVDGKEVSLKDLRGKTVFLDFWGTWCEPCRRGMPDVKAMYEKYHDKGLEVVCIDFSETAETARKYFEEQKYPYFNLLDPNRQVFGKYGDGGIPKVVLIDKDGIVRFFQQGYRTNEDFAAEVRKLGL